MGHLSARAVAHASSSYFLLTAFLKWVPHLFAFLCETVGASTSIQSQNTKRSGSVVPDLQTTQGRVTRTRGELNKGKK
jgi:hypothetical protein